MQAAEAGADGQHESLDVQSADADDDRVTAKALPHNRDATHRRHAG